MKSTTNSIDTHRRDELLLDIDFAAAEHLQRAPQNSMMKPTFDPAKKSLQLELQREMDAAVKTAEHNIRQRTGSKYEAVKVIASVRTAIRAGRGATQVYNAIIERILTPTGAREKQVAIRNFVEGVYPSFSVSRDWTRPLPSWAVKKLKERIYSSAAPFNKIHINPGISLSELHRLAAAAIEKDETGTLNFSAKICVADDKIFINNKPFAITVNPVGARQYRTVRLNVDSLLTALQ